MDGEPRDDESSARTALGTRCRMCAKRIVWPGRCYTCATGLPRRIHRADEEPHPDADHEWRPKRAPASLD
jgi:hypothetical protein